MRESRSTHAQTSLVRCACAAEISSDMRKLTSTAPKKKAQKMALADFFAETSTLRSKRKY